MPLVLAGKRLRGRGHVDAPAARDIVLRFQSGGTYVLDGDVVRADEVRVRPGPIISVLSG